MNKTDQINLLVFGDFGVGNPEEITIDKNLRQVIDQQDIVAVNFEGCVHHGEIISPTMKPVPQSNQSAQWCHDNGINMFLLANNHIMDYGPEGLEKTISTIPQNNVIIGAGSWNEAYSVKILNIKGISLGFIDGTSCDFSALKSPWDDHDKVGAAWVNSHEFTKSIIEGVKQCDHLFVFAHAGVEFLDLPLPEIRDLYRFWIDLGVNGVIASHPHVPQGIEIYKNRPIYYSLGNFIFDGTSKRKERPRYWRNSIAARLSITKKDIKFDYLPIQYNRESHIVKLDNTEKTKEHIEHLINILINDEKYIKTLNSEIPKFAKVYESYILSSANAVQVRPNIKSFKTLLRALLKGKPSPKTLLHQFREESTLNTIARNLKISSNSYL